LDGIDNNVNIDQQKAGTAGSFSKYEDELRERQVQVLR
jgi:hypothetical protein